MENNMTHLQSATRGGQSKTESSAAHSQNPDLTIPPFLDRRNDTDEILLGQINRAVASLIVEEVAVQKAQEGVWSKSKEVGGLLIEAKKRHPKVADFKA